MNGFRTAAGNGVVEDNSAGIGSQRNKGSCHRQRNNCDGVTQCPGQTFRVFHFNLDGIRTGYKVLGNVDGAVTLFHVQSRHARTVDGDRTNARTVVVAVFVSGCVLEAQQDRTAAGSGQHAAVQQILEGNKVAGRAGATTAASAGERAKRPHHHFICGGHIKVAVFDISTVYLFQQRVVDDIALTLKIIGLLPCCSRVTFCIAGSDACGGGLCLRVLGLSDSIIGDLPCSFFQRLNLHVIGFLRRGYQNQIIVQRFLKRRKITDSFIRHRLYLLFGSLLDHKIKDEKNVEGELPLSDSTQGESVHLNVDGQPVKCGQLFSAGSKGFGVGITTDGFAILRILLNGVVPHLSIGGQRICQSVNILDDAISGECGNRVAKLFQLPEAIQSLNSLRIGHGHLHYGASLTLFQNGFAEGTTVINDDTLFDVALTAGNVRTFSTIFGCIH